MWTIVMFDLPNPMVTQPFLYFTDNSLFSHVNYRHEIVIETTLPIHHTVECGERSSHLKTQLVSYKLPSSNLRCEYKNVLHREMEESRQTSYTFDDSLRTHNAFVLHGTELQNFHLRLINRNFVWDGTKYKLDDKLYPLHDDTFYTIQMALRPLK